MKTPVAFLLATILMASAPVMCLARDEGGAPLGKEATASDDGGIFLALAARYFGSDEADIARLSGQWPVPDELLVGLFVSARSGRPREQVFGLRKSGLSWWEVGGETGLPAESWFVPVAKDPGPPFGRAYGHWRRLREEGTLMPALDDEQMRDLVAVRFLHESFEVPVETAMSWRAGGRDVRTLAAQEYRKRHASDRAPSPDRGNRSDRSPNNPDKPEPADRRQLPLTVPGGAECPWQESLAPVRLARPSPCPPSAQTEPSRWISRSSISISSAIACSSRSSPPPMS